jgi:hypothetical protein
MLPIIKLRENSKYLIGSKTKTMAYAGNNVIIRTSNGGGLGYDELLQHISTNAKKDCWQIR